MSPASPTHARAAGEPPAPGTDAAGVDGRYRPLLVVGRGGMGRVEVALERGGGEAGRLVALKRLLPEAASDPRLTDMFLREARLAASLSHPNVVHAFDFGERGGELFMAMEYVEGEPLSQVLAVGRARGVSLAPALAAHVLAEICAGLHAAHELEDAGGAKLNVVHRDVSPHNVMIAYDGRIKLLDFGVAKTDLGGGLTRTGEVKGKVAYMSPEQAMGDALDRRSDLYSIGAVLFECVAGRRMWPGTDMEVLRQLALETPPRLEDAAPGAPPELCAIYTRLVERQPLSRPASARLVEEELRAFAATDASSGAGRAMEAQMALLFAGAAAQRREALARAIDGAGVDERAPAESNGHAVAPAPSLAPAARHLVPTRRVAILSALAVVGALVALGARAVVLSRPHVAASAPREDVVSSPPPPPPPSPPSPVAPASSTPPRVVGETPPVPPAATPSSLASPRSLPGAPRARPASPKASPRVAAPPSPSTRPIDVDPDPI